MKMMASGVMAEHLGTCARLGPCMYCTSTLEDLQFRFQGCFLVNGLIVMHIYTLLFCKSRELNVQYIYEYIVHNDTEACIVL